VKHLLHVIPSINPAIGGPSQVAISLAEHFTSTSQSYELLTLDSPKDDFVIPSSIRLRTFRGVRLLRVISLCWYVMRKKNVDSLYIHGLHLPASWLPSLVARARKIPYCVQLHGTLEPHEFLRQATKKLLFHKLVGDRFLRKAVGVVVASNSESVNAQIRVPGIRTWVIPLAATLETPESMSFIESSTCWANSTRETRVVFLGRSPRKSTPKS